VHFSTNVEVPMSLIFDGVGMVLKRLGSFLPSRLESLKNEKDKLNAEKELILSSPKPFNVKQLNRVHNIDTKIAEIKTILGNNAKD